ncbi:right-handed parallel beta-helix repeat-containing protein [Noviherbaspirillum pedocola]|uniref:Right-handed parallel beta-helix repeat-containing protein n=1 Tax=Noviherbaspirillum pedocola TaxID=2801341 RepID=A0A934SSG6_9BURK|nr:right-handed parallel beta-helix repeat-containing protein [Noviherbaspirillum pedocola]MBK4734767.1 right-handed parallel beta-helix repeat-containing protein [Noviherbaspirillum pedocola]
MQKPIRHLVLSVTAAALQLNAASAQSLPPEPSYKGELRSDGKGGVVVMPFADPGRGDNGEAAPSQKTEPPVAQQPRASAQPNPAKPQVAPRPAPDATPPAVIAAGPTTLRVGAGRELRTIAEAAKRARNGDTILIDPGVYPADVAVFNQDRLVIRAVGGRAQLNANGANAEGKAIWVMRGGDILVENIEFHGARVPDHNGAGIRFEHGKLTVRNCLFADNENGILTSGEGSELNIENSEFDHNGTEAGNAHQLYVGSIPRLKVIGSYFHNTAGGHLLKSRADNNFITYNRLTDEAGGQGSYELEFPNGGVNYVIGNIIEQAPTTQNSAIISVGAEGMNKRRNELYLVNNTIVDDREGGGNFLKMPTGLQALKAVNNLLVGSRKSDLSIFAEDVNHRGEPGKVFQVDLGTRVGDTRAKGEVSNNFSVSHDVFAQAAKYDYRLRERSGLAGKYLPPGTSMAASGSGLDLAPRAEYAHRAQTRRLAAAPTLPGALQTPAP